MKKVFKVKNSKDLEKIAWLNLNDFKCGLYLYSTCFIRLLTILKNSQKMRLDLGFTIDWVKSSTNKIKSEKLKKKMKKIKCFDNGVMHLSFLNVRGDNAFSSKIIR